MIVNTNLKEIKLSQNWSWLNSSLLKKKYRISMTCNKSKRPKKWFKTKVYSTIRSCPPFCLRRVLQQKAIRIQSFHRNRVKNVENILSGIAKSSKRLDSKGWWLNFEHSFERCIWSLINDILSILLEGKRFEGHVRSAFDESVSVRRAAVALWPLGCWITNETSGRCFVSTSRQLVQQQLVTTEWTPTWN